MEFLILFFSPLISWGVPVLKYGEKKGSACLTASSTRNTAQLSGHKFVSGAGKIIAGIYLLTSVSGTRGFSAWLKLIALFVYGLAGSYIHYCSLLGGSREQRSQDPRV